MDPNNFDYTSFEKGEIKNVQNKIARIVMNEKNYLVTIKVLCRENKKAG
jgi:hypothetical protein